MAVVVTACIVVSRAHNYPQYSFYGEFDPSYLNESVANDVVASRRIPVYIELAELFGLSESQVVDLYYRLYEIENTSVVFYGTVNDHRLPFFAEEGVGYGLSVNFGPRLIVNEKPEGEKYYRLRFAYPVERIPADLFVEDITYLRFPSVSGLQYESSPKIRVDNLAAMEGRDVIDSRFLVGRGGMLIAAAVGGLKKCEVPSAVKTVGSGSLQGSGLQEIVLPESVRRVGQNAFAHCPNLKKITFKSTERVTIDDDCFDSGTLARLNIYVPKSLVKEYKERYPELKKKIKGY